MRGQEKRQGKCLSSVSGHAAFSTEISSWTEVSGSRPSTSILNYSSFHFTGLYNGALVYVTAISKEFDQDNFPTYIFIKADVYRGVPFPLRRDIPIVPCTYPFFDKYSGRTYQKRQFPIQLAFGLTAFRSQVRNKLLCSGFTVIPFFLLQGKTCRNVVVGNPSPGDHSTMFTSQSPHLGYVCLSRVTTLEGLMFQRPFSADIIVGSGRSLAVQDWQNELRRLEALEEETLRNINRL